MRRLKTLALLAWLLSMSTVTAQNFVGNLPAIEFPGGLEWLNTDEPLTLAELRGKVVLLDFWTYGCINCLHVIPDLQRLEAKYAEELVVIGVHSGKFDHERDSENIRRFAERYGRTHPIVNDRDFQVWRTYGIRAWPSFILIDPEGRVLGHHAGEGIFDLFDEVIAGMIATFEARGTLDRRPLNFVREQPRQPTSPLRFPGKVLADEAGERLFIADSGHHRIVVTNLEGSVLAVIGGMDAGFRDGTFAEARFRQPQGMALADEHTLYVADTGNHSIRRVDLIEAHVVTVAGVGEQHYLFGAREVAARESGLNSPWDVLYLNGQLYIAMAGQHQLWRYDPRSERVLLHAGSGFEALVDGPLLRAGFNQPSGLATDGKVLYLADSEASAVRRVALVEDGEVETLVGVGLFDFGDVDGVGDEVRLQHPKGVAHHQGLLYVADTYNHKIKRLDPATRESVTLFGSGERGWRDGVDGLFYEPSGVSVAGEVLYIADTNNHAVRIANLQALKLRTLTLEDEAGLLLGREGEDFWGEEVVLEPQRVAAGSGEVRLNLTLPEGYQANHLAPLTVAWQSDGSALTLSPAEASLSVTQPDYPLTLAVPAHFTAGEASLRGELTVYYCQEEAAALCLIDQVRLVVPVSVAPEGAPFIEVAYQVPPLEAP